MMYEATLKDRALFWRIEGQSLVLNKNVKKCFLKIDQSKFFFLSSLPKKYKPRCAFCDLDFSWPFFFIFSLLVVHSEYSELFINSFRLSNLWNHSLIRGVLIKCQISKILKLIVPFWTLHENDLWLWLNYKIHTTTRQVGEFRRSNFV